MPTLYCSSASIAARLADISRIFFNRLASTYGLMTTALSARSASQDEFPALTIIHSRLYRSVDLPLPRIPRQGNDHLSPKRSGRFRLTDLPHSRETIHDCCQATLTRSHVKA